MRILWRYIASEYLKAFVATLVGVCTIFLVVDYVDRAKMYAGGGWAVVELYGWKAVTVAYQLAPAAMLLACGMALAGIRRRGEYTAMRALAVSPMGLLMPILASALMLAGGVVLADELVVGKASRRIDEISVTKFKYWGDWRMYYGGHQWFRGDRHIYYLRSGDPDEGFRNVTIFTLSDDFRLAERVDAESMTHLDGARWVLKNGIERGLSGNRSEVEPFDQREFVLDKDASAFRISKGRPESMRLSRLREQVRLRREVGLPAERYVLAMHNRFAYPLGGLAGALLAFAFVLRPGRRVTMTSAMAEGFLIIVLLWMLLVVFKAAAIASLVSAPIAAWMPVLIISAAGLVAVRVLAR